MVSAAGLLEGRCRPRLAGDGVPQLRPLARNAERAFGLLIAVVAVGHEVQLGVALGAVQEIERRPVRAATVREVRGNALLRKNLAQ